MDGPATASTATVRLAFPPEPRLLATVRLVVGIVARQTGIDEESVEDLKVAVSETCAVAVGDLARLGLDTPIELDLVELPDRLAVEVRHRAPPPAPTPAGGVVDDRQFGLALVDALVDELRTEILEGGGHRTSFWLWRADDGLPPPLS